MKRIGLVHIPKTGGNTLKHIVFQHLSQAECAPLVPYRDPKILDTAMFLYGHAPYDSYPPDCDLYTLLRDPVERMLSYYEMARRSTREQWKNYDLFHAGGREMTLFEFAHNGIKMTHHIKNGMTRQLAGRSAYLADRPVNKVDLELAKAHLQTMTFGFADHFDELGRLLCRRCGWDYGTYERKGVSPPYLHQYTDADRQMLAEAQPFDVALYTWAVAEYRKRNVA